MLPSGNAKVAAVVRRIGATRAIESTGIFVSEFDCFVTASASCDCLFELALLVGNNYPLQFLARIEAAMDETNLKKRLRAAVAEGRPLADALADTINLKSIGNLGDSGATVKTIEGWFIFVARNQAFAISGNEPGDKQLMEAFSHCGLDAERPHHWRLLLESLVDICFSKLGAPTKWGDGILDLVDEIKQLQARNPKLIGASSLEIAKVLKKKNPGKYQIKAGSLRKRVATAMSESVTPAWSLVGAELIQENIKRASEKLDRSLSSESLQELFFVFKEVTSEVIANELVEKAMIIAKSSPYAEILQLGSSPEHDRAIGKKIAKKAAVRALEESLEPKEK